MSRTIRAVAVQLRAHDRERFAPAFEEIAATLDAAAAGADLMVLPEATLPSYVLGTTPLDPNVLRPAIERLQAIARHRHTVIVAGAASTTPDGDARNSAFVIDADGSLAGQADKFFLWHFDRRWFRPGEAIEPVQTSLGRIGVLVCADGRIPTIARALVDRGAQVLAMPTAWVTSGRNPEVLENVQADLLARVRAYENGVPFVAANKCGTERGMVAYCGKSQIVDAGGRIVAIASCAHAETIAATVEIGDPSPHRSGWGALATPPAIRSARIALSAVPIAPDDPRIAWLDAVALVAPPLSGPSFASFATQLPATLIEGAAMLDPGLPAAFRLAGYALLVWQTSGDAWTESIARARALELRAYVVAVTASRTFGVDPDGVVVAGTFGDYAIATMQFDAARVAQTEVAPGSDVLEALHRVATLTAENPKAPA